MIFTEQEDEVAVTVPRSRLVLNLTRTRNGTNQDWVQQQVVYLETVDSLKETCVSLAVRWHRSPHCRCPYE